jgi:hypothetical protein
MFSLVSNFTLNINFEIKVSPTVTKFPKLSTKIDFICKIHLFNT